MHPPRGRRHAALALAALLGAGITAGTATTSQAAAGPAPVSTAAMADPGVLLSGGTFYAFATGTGPDQLRESTASTAGGPWTTPTNQTLTNTPAWMDTSKALWAPDMIQTTSGTYVVYFAALLNPSAGTPTGIDAPPAGGARCIGSAESSSPDGPFAVDPTPVVCLDGYGASDPMSDDPGDRAGGEGAIDPSPVFVNWDGQTELFLVYKTQAPTDGQYSTIRMVRLADADGTTVVGDSHQLLRSASDTFADTIEGPSLVQTGSWFVLFVSHGNYTTCGYSTEWYKSQHIWAWNQTPGGTLLDGSTNGWGLCGPGGADATGSKVAGQDRLFFDAMTDSTREMYSLVLTFGSDGTPAISLL